MASAIAQRALLALRCGSILTARHMYSSRKPPILSERGAGGGGGRRGLPRKRGKGERGYHQSFEFESKRGFQGRQTQVEAPRKSRGTWASSETPWEVLPGQEELAKEDMDWLLYGPRRGDGATVSSGLDEDDGGDEDSVLDSPFLDAVVKVYCTHTEPNFSLPWQKRRQFASTGSGFVIAGRRLLTNAHCVEHHTQVKVKRRGDDTKFVARVLAIGVECDIALLTVDDEAFWAPYDSPVPNAESGLPAEAQIPRRDRTISPLRFGPLPRLEDSVTVVGYPIGGDSISVTSGVVSRIEVTAYAHGSSELLGVQIDAAINAGNSGGPAFNEDGECVGIAFQSLKDGDAENIGYIIPTPVIFHFLRDYARNGRYTGFPCMGIHWQRLENPALRAALKMAPGQKGVMLRRVEPTAQAASVLRPGDVVLSFDGVPIANDGTVTFRSGERISFGFLVSQKFSGDTARLAILRDGAQSEVDVALQPPKRMVPVHTQGQPPKYLIVAGLVFTAAVQPFLESEYGSQYEYESPVPLLQHLLHGMAEHEDQEVVVLSQVLAHEANLGYEDISNSCVKSVDGVPVRNMRHLAALIEGNKGPFLKIELDHAQLVVLDKETIRQATEDVMADHSIPHDRSEDLRNIVHQETENGATTAAC